MPLTPEQIAEFDKITGNQTPTTSPAHTDTSEIDAAIASGTKRATDLKGVNADKGTFAADPNQQVNGAGDVLGMAARTGGNIPKSGFNFVKGALESINPVEIGKKMVETNKTAQQAGAEGVTAGDVLKEIPHEAYKALVPQFLQHIFSGDFGKASATLQNDPVGQIAPFLLMAKQGAEAMGKGAEFDAAMTKVAAPVTKTVEAVGSGAGKAASQVIGAGTGSGASSVKQAFNAAKEGPASLDAFTKAMRGETPPEQIVQTAHDIVGKVKEARGNAYVEQLKAIGEDKTSHDISPVHAALDANLKKFGVKVKPDGTLDFSRSSIANNGSARADIQGVYETLKDWGTQKGDRTGVGLDILKKQLGDFYSPSSQARAFVQGVKGPLTDLLNEKVPGYKDLTASYSKASNFLDEIKSATGAGSNAKPDTVFTKLTSAMKGDKEFRLQIMDEMTKTDPTFMSKIAGTNMSSWIPKGLIGKGADVGAVMQTLASHFNPSLIPMILGTSPRIMGEFLRAAGMTSSKITPIIDAINTMKVPQGSPDKLGMSVQDVTKNVHPEDQQIMRDFIDSARIDKHISDSTYSMAETLAERFGISMDKGLKGVANKFEQILSKQKKKK